MHARICWHNLDSTLTPKQLQLAFRAECELARNPLFVPRLKCSLQIHELQDALAGSEALVVLLQLQLLTYKRYYLAARKGEGRHRRLELLPGESFLALMQRTHLDALKWRPPGRPPAAPSDALH